MRKKAWQLLLAPAGILVLGTGVLELKTYPVLHWEFLPWLLAVIVLSFGVQLFLEHRAPETDPWLFPLVMFFSSIGLIMIARLKPV